MDSSSEPTPENTSTEKADEEVGRGRGKRNVVHGGRNEATSSQPPKPRRLLDPRSEVWTYFTRTTENRDKCKCNYCQKVFACPTSSGTSNLKSHIIICKHFKAWKDGQISDEGKSQSVLNESGGLSSAKVSIDIFKEATDEMLVIGELPLSFVESIAWKYFCEKVRLYKPHSRRTSTRNIVKMYVAKKRYLMEMFKAWKQRISITTDIWVAQPTGASYMVVTAHFVDQFWKLKKFIIGFKHITDHKGRTIAAVLIDCLAEWGIEKVFSITVDNATANTSALKRFHEVFSLLSPEALVLDGDHMHIRCCAHIINLIVKDGLTQVDASKAAIRNGISYVRSNSTRLSSFELRVDSGKMKRGSLPLDVKTRWNSTYTMLFKALKYRVAFEKMLKEDKLYGDYFNELDNGTKRIGPSSSSDWEAVERLVRFLVIFYDSTLIVSASTTLNSYKCYGEIVTIEKNLMNICKSLDSELKKKAEVMFDKFDKYWDGMKGRNKLLIIASVFDPRKKMGFANMCFARLYGEDSYDAIDMNQSVTVALRSMFDEYNATYQKLPNSQSSKSNQEQSSGQSQERVEVVEDDLGLGGYERMDSIYKYLIAETRVHETRDELDMYLKESVENPDTMEGTEYDVLDWWKHNSGKFPVLSEMAKDVLAIQVSSVASESAFSTSGRIITPSRSCLTHYMVEVLMCTEQWMKQDIQCKGVMSLVTREQIISEFEYEDKLKREFDTPPTEDEMMNHE